MRKYSFILILLLAWSPWFLGALQVWNSGTFEQTPANGDSISLGDDEIREFKENVRKRAQVELLWGTDIAGGETGRLREGAARAFYADPCPTVLSNSVNDTTGIPDLGTGDDGRFCRDSTTGELKMWSGTAWIQALTALSGTINWLGTPLLQKAGADAMDVHAHDARHRLGGSGAAGWTNAADGIPFAIQQIVIDGTMDAACAAGISNTAIAGQVFGDAGAGCLSIGGAASVLDFTGRTGNSRILVFAALNLADGTAASCAADSGIFLDSVAAPMGLTLTSSMTLNSGNTARDAPTLIGYLDTVAGAAVHEIAVHITDSSDDGCVATSGYMLVVDLGNST